MRLVLLISLVVLGVTWAVEEKATISALTSEEEEEQEAFLDDMTDGQGRIGLGRMLGDIFEDDAGEEAEADMEVNDNVSESWEERSRYDTSAAEKRLSAQAQHQYNNLVDTLLRRVNADARKLDPMMVPIVPDKKKYGLRKKTRYPKLLNTDGTENSFDNNDTEPLESEHNLERREANEEEGEEEEEEDLAEEGRRLYPEEEDGNMVDAQSRRIKLPKRKKNNNNRSKGKGKGKGKNRRKQNKKKPKKTSSKNNNKNNKNKRNNRNNSKNKKRSGNRNPKSQSNRGTKNGNRISYLPSVRTSRAEVTGFATLRRDGDVKIITRSNGITEVRTDLVTGPVNLKVTRKFGTGKDTITRIGNVASPQMKGSMVISIDAHGKKQKISKFQILRPSIVTTHGSLAKEPTKRRDNNFLESTLPRATPVVTRKLMFVARDILNAN